MPNSERSSPRNELHSNVIQFPARLPTPSRPSAAVKHRNDEEKIASRPRNSGGWYSDVDSVAYREWVRLIDVVSRHMSSDGFLQSGDTREFAP